MSLKTQHLYYMLDKQFIKSYSWFQEHLMYMYFLNYTIVHTNVYYRRLYISDVPGI
nr:MAG TPA: hypothetical protein [Caudoviricetes sp.]